MQRRITGGRYTVAAAAAAAAAATDTVQATVCAAASLSLAAHHSLGMTLAGGSFRLLVKRLRDVEAIFSESRIGHPIASPTGMQ